MADTFKTRDKKLVTDGDLVNLVLQHGSTEKDPIKGRVRSFRPNTEQIAELEAKLAVLKSDNGIRWEIMTGDPTYPAVGFVPENALTIADS